MRTAKPIDSLTPAQRAVIAALLEAKQLAELAREKRVVLSATSPRRLPGAHSSSSGCPADSEAQRAVRLPRRQVVAGPQGEPRPSQQNEIGTGDAHKAVERTAEAVVK
jgi:hypothetical protein